jgi:cellulose synthase/poly-beta-1,6-N-acetylglucosamine synthase-like glycosyltransferase
VRQVGGWRYAHSTEDMEIALRLQEQGYIIVNNPRVHVRTSAPRTFPALFKQRVRWSYGFLRNIFDYRHMLGNKTYGNLGLIILPAALISIASALFFASRLLWLGAFEVADSFNRATLGAGLTPSFDPFFINTSAMILTLFAALGMTVVLISFGSLLSTGSRKIPAATPLFLLLYGLIVPLWLSTALVKALRGRGVAWR